MDAPTKSPAAGGRTGTVVVWAARAVWVALAVVGGEAIGQALAVHSRAVQMTGTAGSWAGWAVVALAMVVPSTVSLSVIRSIVPVGVVVAIMSTLAGAEALEATLCTVLAVVACALVATGEFGEAFVQASAYGDERRLLLRPPLGFLVPAVVSWTVLCGVALAGPLTLAARNWLVGGPLTAAAVALGWFLGRRFHRLSRRWLVLVPAGLVVHDHLVLAETVMFQRSAVESVGLALSGTEAADLTGPAAGHALEVVLRELNTVVLAPSRQRPNGTVLHVGSFLVAPTRPGRALAAAAARRLPLG